MLKKAKWVRSDQANLPISRIAGTVVPARLDAVWHYAPLAALAWKKEVEHVHQLRVSTRRAAAAMDTLAEMLPRRRAKGIAKTLDLLRRAAGQARDLDVLAIRLRAQSNGNQRELAWALDTIAQQRLAAQKPLRRIHKRLRRDDFPRECRQLAKRIRWRSEHREPTYGEAAQFYLLRVVNDFVARSGANLQAMRNLHALRIEGKRLRYTFEILSGAFGRDVRDEVYPCIKSLQQELGAVCDHDAARRALGRWAKNAENKRGRKMFQSLANAERIALESSRAEFTDRWTRGRWEEFEDLLRSAIHPL